VEIKTLYTCCEQVGRRGKDWETKRNETIHLASPPERNINRAQRRLNKDRFV
jgi:hypothetical protein